MTRASKQTIVADSARIGSMAIRRASGLLEPTVERERRVALESSGCFIGRRRINRIVWRVGFKVMRNTDLEVWGRFPRMESVCFVLVVRVLGYGMAFGLLLSLRFCFVIRTMSDLQPLGWACRMLAAASKMTFGGSAFPRQERSELTGSS